MAIVFTKQRRNQRILIIVSLLIIVISAIVLSRLFLKKEVSYIPPAEVSLPLVREIKINFDVLEKIKQFQPFAEIQPLKEVSPTEERGVEGVKIGRENPFLPY